MMKRARWRKPSPLPYPNDWVIVHDIAFDHMSIGRFMVMDINGGDIKDFFQREFQRRFYFGLYPGPEKTGDVRTRTLL